MLSRSAFHLDCTPIIPACGFQCEKCLKEMESVFAKVPGVGRFQRKGDGVVVEHDPAIAPVEKILDIFRTLPSFYKGFFVPTVK